MSKVSIAILNNVGAFIGAILAMIVFDFIMAFPIKWAWNHTMTYIFNLPIINYWHAFWLFFILTALWKVTVVSHKNG